MSNLRDLLAKANAVTAKPVIRESAPKVESSFDDLDTFIQDVSTLLLEFIEVKTCLVK